MRIATIGSRIPGLAATPHLPRHRERFRVSSFQGMGHAEWTLPEPGRRLSLRIANRQGPGRSSSLRRDRDGDAGAAGLPLSDAALSLGCRDVPWHRHPSDTGRRLELAS